MGIGENIKKIRNDKKIKQIVLASNIGISVRTLQKYESGEITPPIDKVQKLADTLQVSLFDLIGEEYKNAMKDFANDWNSKTQEERELLNKSTKDKWKNDEFNDILEVITIVAEKADCFDLFLTENDTLDKDRCKAMFNIFIEQMKLYAKFSKVVR